MTRNGPVPAGVTEANNIFNGNMATIMRLSDLESGADLDHDQDRHQP